MTRCTECDGEVKLETDHLGPWAAQALLPPLRVLCHACIKAEGLEVHVEGPLRWVYLRGQEFTLLCGAFVRSEHPRMLRTHRDQQTQQ